MSTELTYEENPDKTEAERGRAFDLPRHSPRPLDVDLLLLGDLQLRTDRLTLPHPEVTSRRFVLAPLLGSVVFEILRTFAIQYAPNAWQFVVGGCLLAVIMFLPGGLWSLIERSREGEHGSDSTR